jgi:hypothetical protein
MRLYTRYRHYHAYIVESGHLRKAYILRGTNEGFLCRRKDAAFEVRGTSIAVYEDVGFAEVGFAAAMEVLVGFGELVEIGGGLGSL